MIDVYAPNDLLPAGSDRRIGEALTLAVLRAEGISAPGPFHLDNTAAFIHRMDPPTVQTAAEPLARNVRIQIITPPGALTRDGQKQLVKDATAIVADVCGDPSHAKRTWVLLTEAAEGGWGIAGTAFGREEFTSAAERRAACDVEDPGAAHEDVQFASWAARAKSQSATSVTARRSCRPYSGESGSGT
jgi:phenylpyruvate tautomerase PptA (4-oxalocrotonate tautomerase family)